MELSLSSPIRWSDRSKLPNLAGVYLIAKDDPENLIYIGRTWGNGGIRKRIAAFNRSATSGLKGHAGGVTFNGIFGVPSEDLWVSTHVNEQLQDDPTLLHPYVAFAERLLIWNFVKENRRLPKCNSE